MKADASRALLREADGLGHEARAEGGDHAALKLWLRLLACTTQIEDEIRRRLRLRFGISLPRFDYLAQLYRAPQGLKMKDLSRQLMVTGGNVTGLTDELLDRRADRARPQRLRGDGCRTRVMDPRAVRRARCPGGAATPWPAGRVARAPDAAQRPSPMTFPHDLSP